MKIFLDDKREISDVHDELIDWVLARNFSEFKKLVETNQVSTVSFDNDLGQDENGNALEEGSYVLNWLINNDIIIPYIFVHTDNVAESENITCKARNWHKFLKSDNLLTDCWVIRKPATHIRWEREKKKAAI